MSDFEKAQKNALKFCLKDYKNINYLGCYFLYVKALWQKAN